MKIRLFACFLSSLPKRLNLYLYVFIYFLTIFNTNIFNIILAILTYLLTYYLLTFQYKNMAVLVTPLPSLKMFWKVYNCINHIIRVTLESRLSLLSLAFSKSATSCLFFSISTPSFTFNSLASFWKERISDTHLSNI